VPRRAGGLGHGRRRCALRRCTYLTPHTLPHLPPHACRLLLPARLPHAPHYSCLPRCLPRRTSAHHLSCTRTRHRARCHRYRYHAPRHRHAFTRAFPHLLHCYRVPAAPTPQLPPSPLRAHIPRTTATHRRAPPHYRHTSFAQPHTTPHSYTVLPHCVTCYHDHINSPLNRYLRLACRRASYRAW